MTEVMTEEALFELLSLDCSVDEYGTVRYYNALGQRHRVYGPAVVCSDGYRAWYINDQLHSLGRPAIEYTDGGRAWYIDGKELTQDEWQQVVTCMESV